MSAHPLGAASRRSPQACASCRHLIRPPWLMKPYFRADHFNGGRITGRNEDPLKPIQSRTKSQDSLTRLTIDHITPELRLGWTYPDNLQFLCAFCNQAKLAYRRALEPVSIFCAGALSDLSQEDPAVGVRSTIMVSIIRANGRSCHLCRRTWSNIELTVFHDTIDTVAFSAFGDEVNLL
jgi:hypothetical protein